MAPELLLLSPEHLLREALAHHLQGNLPDRRQLPVGVDLLTLKHSLPYLKTGTSSLALTERSFRTIQPSTALCTTTGISRRISHHGVFGQESIQSNSEKSGAHHRLRRHYPPLARQRSEDLKVVYQRRLKATL